MKSQLNIHSPESKHSFIGESVRHSFAGGAYLFKQMENKDELWKDIIGFEGLYQISNLGRVKSLKRVLSVKIKHNVHSVKKEKILTHSFSSGYNRVGLFKNGKGTSIHIHRLLAIHFIPNPENKLQVNHKNGVRTDFRIDNLEWVTCSENNLHAWNILMRKRIKGKDNLQSKAVNQIDLNNNIIKKFDSIYDAGRELKIFATAISRCAHGRRPTAYGYKWKFV